MTATVTRPGLFNRALAYLVRLVPVNARLLLLAAAGVATAGLVTVFSGSLETFEESVGSLGWTLNAGRDVEERITIVAIDEKSVAQEGPWPWSRDTMARLVTALNQAGVQLQLHDIVYPEAREGDDLLLAALQASNGAVLAQVPVLQSEQDVRTGQMTHSLSGIACNADLASASSFVANTAAYSAIPKGHITPIVSGDGAIR